MTLPDPSQQYAQEVSSIQREISSLQTEVRLASLRDRIENLQTQLNNLPQRISTLRSRKYVMEKDLETRASQLSQQWAGLRSSIENQIQSEAYQLQNALSPIEYQFNRIAGLGGNPESAMPLVSQLKANISTLKSKVSAAQTTINGMYDKFNGEVGKVEQQIVHIEWSMKQLDEASFTLLPSEAMIMAVKATWIKGSKEVKEDPQGVLFLTDQRVIFEQKQEIATQKMLFITTKTEKVQKLLFDNPVQLATEVKPTKQGLLKNEDHLEMSFSSGANQPNVHLHIFGQDCAAWQALVQRARSQDFDHGRTTPVDQQATEKAQNAPTKCPSCGGMITKPVLRGQNSITCDYCGQVIRVG